LTGALAIAAPGNDRHRSATKVRAAKQTTTMTNRGNTAVRTRSFATRGNTSVRTRSFATSGNTAVRTRTFSDRSRVVSSSTGTVRYSQPYRSYSYSYGYPSYGYSYGYGYPSYGFGFGWPYYGYYPYSYGYYPYDYGYYPYDYSYGYYSYNRPGYAYNGSVVSQVQSRLARAGYYRGPIDGIMGPGTRYAIRAYERDHGLRVDGVISGSLLRNMGLRY
jgi:hypothetical protein